MRTATSALFIALCILFAATYATALRRPGYESLRKNIVKHTKKSLAQTRERRTRPATLSEWSIKPIPIQPIRPFADSEWYPYPSPYNPNPPRPDLMSDAELSFRPPVYTTFPVRPKPIHLSDRLWEPSPYNPNPPRFDLMSDAELSYRPPVYTTFPVRPKYELYSDAEWKFPVGWTPPKYNPVPMPKPYLMSDAEFGYRPPVYTTVPEYPRRELFADRSIPTWAQPSPFNPNPRPTFWSDEEFDEEFDEEDWGVNGNIGSGGQWNLGGSYSNNGFTGSANVGNGGQWNVGGSYTNGGFTGGVTAGNGGSWSANAGYNTKVGGGDLSVGGQVSNGGNWGVGATYNLRF